MKWAAAFARKRSLEARPELDAAYGEHNVPGEAVAGALTVVRVRVENRGVLDWLRDAPDGRYAGLGVFFDGRQVATGRADRESVAPGELATFAAVVSWPDEPGLHCVRLDLMINGRTWFSEAGVAPLETPVRLRPREGTRTEDLMALSHRYNAWFFSPGLGIHRRRSGEPAYPMFAESAVGCHVTDVDGREYVDVVMGWGACLLGHADERVQAAVARSLSTSSLPTVPHRLEVEVSEALCSFGLGDQALFGKNGSDVTTWAVRAARAVTGRRTIVFAGYHGWQDWNGSLLGFAASGIPGGDARHAVRVPYGDVIALESAVATHASDLAAVLIEPAATAAHVDDPYHDRDGPYLHRAQDSARRRGALFILDEIFTAFRFRGGSAQRHYQLTPDLTCVGKALANGMPLSALVGRQGVLSRSVERILYVATYRGEVHSYAAALESLRAYRDEDVPSQVWAAGDEIRRGVEAACAQIGVPARLVGPPYRMYFAFDGGSPAERVHWRTLLQQELAAHGVISHKGYVIPSRRHDPAAVSRCVAAFAAALGIIRRARDEGSALPYLDIPDVAEEGRS